MPRVVRCPNCHGPLEVDPKAPVLRCPYCHHDVKQTIALPPPEPEPPKPQIVVVEKRVVVAAPPELVRHVSRAGRGIGCATSLVTLVIIAVAAGIPLWQSGLLRNLVGGVKDAIQGDPEPIEARKLDAISDMLGVSERVRDAYQRYHGWLESPDGPTCRERHISHGLYEVSLGGIERGQKAIGEEPKLPELDAAAAGFATAFREGAAIFNEAHRYYDQKDYRDDACARGRTLHPALGAAFQRVTTEERKLRSLLVEKIGAFLKRRLERWRREAPGGGNATTIQVLIDARELAFEIERQQGPAGEAGEAPAAAAGAGAGARVWARIRPLQASLRAAAAAPAESGRQSSITWPHTFDSHLKGSVETFLKETKAYAREPSRSAADSVASAWNSIVRSIGWAGPGLSRAQIRRPPRGYRTALEGGAPIAARGLPLEVVQRVVAAHQQHLRRCLPAKTERVVLRFSVGKTGRVTAAELTEPVTLAPPVKRCLESAVRRWVFPATGREFTITYPIRFAH